MVGFPIILLLGVLAVGALAYRRLRRIRFSLLEFIVLVLLTGLGIGLTARLFPSETPKQEFGLVLPVAMLVGSGLFWGGAQGLFAAHWLGVARPAARLGLLVRGLFLLPALVGATPFSLYLAAKGARRAGWAGLSLNAMLLLALLGSFLCIVHLCLLWPQLRAAAAAERAAEDPDRQKRRLRPPGAPAAPEASASQDPPDAPR